MKNLLLRFKIIIAITLVCAASYSLVTPVAAQNAAMPQTKPKILSSGVENPQSLMWLGNSFFYYNNSMHGHFNNLLVSANPEYKLRQSSITISGSGFGWHDLDNLFRPKAIGSYSFVGDNEIKFNSFERLFDLVIMLDCSQCPIHPQLGALFTQHSKEYSVTARKHGAKPVFFMTWAYSDKPEMTLQLAEAYIKAANDNDAFVIPVGLAFANSIAKNPAINLYIADKRHPSMAGTYLGAVTTYAALFKKSPVGIKYTAGLSPEVATHLQQVAWETVQAFYQ